MARKDRISHRQQRAREKRRLILVMVEGETEECYFTKLKKKTKVLGITVECACAEHSTPDSVIKCAQKAKTPFGVAYDERWVVYDTDVLSTDELNQTLSQAGKGSLQCAISNPCFEYWLLLHHEYCTPSFNSSDHCIRRLQERDATYRKGKSNAMESYLEESKVRTAVAHAERVMQSHRFARNDEPHPHPSTTVHLLVKKLLSQV
ncbi:RloB domain-containing protein [Akkermansia glycaniphila]|uniref:RloB family protein n=1 Tax=Akkermansia glycaniphila TaxID=1679444 RepID=UPI001C02841F|nr:RloB family protein [Akkermansia glycaniphila]MBT9448755.1 RloB domain-containing protein [Akkermansia glycaniphila]